jgi:hypothetical protein
VFLGLDVRDRVNLKKKMDLPQRYRERREEQ